MAGELRFHNQKAARIEAVVVALKERGTLHNRELRALLNVSERTVVRYMDEIEALGLVVQQGKTGETVSTGSSARTCGGFGS